MKPLQIHTREEWLLEAASLIVNVIETQASLAIPKFRVTCGFPDKGGRKGGKTRVRGQCWAASASKDGHAEIMISPVEDDRREVLQILAHELIHAGLPGAGHGAPFQRAARAIGFVGPWTTSNASEAFWFWADKILAGLPDYPHAELNAVAPVAAPKPQKNRQLKCVCQTCGYVARTSRKWIETMGPPHCPLHGAMVFVDPDLAQDLRDAA